MRWKTPPLPPSLSQLLEEWADSSYGKWVLSFRQEWVITPWPPHSVTTKKAPIISLVFANAIILFVPYIPIILFQDHSFRRKCVTFSKTNIYIQQKSTTLAAALELCGNVSGRSSGKPEFRLMGGDLAWLSLAHLPETICRTSPVTVHECTLAKAFLFLREFEIHPDN